MVYLRQSFFFVIDEKERICPFDAQDTSILSFSYALSEASHFVGEVLATKFCMFWVVAQLEVL